MSVPGVQLRISLVLGHQLPFPPSAGGGVNNLLWSLARQFRRDGHLVTVCSPLTKGLRRDEIDADGIRHVRCVGFPPRRGKWWNNIAGLPYALRLWARLPLADVTSFHAPFSFLLRRRTDLGVCTHTIHRTPKWIIRFYGKMDRIYAGSHATVREALRIAPKLAGIVKAVHNCVEFGDWHSINAGDLEEECSLIYVGRFVRDKGLETLICSVMDACRAGCLVRLTTIGPQCNKTGGDSGFFEHMKQLVADSRLASRFTFVPSVQDRTQLRSWIDRHDALCLPSLSGETLSMAALEAMARGKPLLTSDYGPMPELVSHGINGIIVPAGRQGAWAEAIALVTSMKNCLPIMGRQSFNKVQREFNVETIANEYISDFRSLINLKYGREPVSEE